MAPTIPARESPAIYTSQTCAYLRAFVRAVLLAAVCTADSLTAFMFLLICHLGEASPDHSKILITVTGFPSGSAGKE